MHNSELARQIDILNTLFDKTTDATGGDIEFQSHWAKYLCILCSGFLENSLYEIYGSFVDNSSSPYVASFTRKALSRIQNPKAQNFITVAYNFNHAWGEKLQEFLVDSGGKDAIDAIMDNRNRIAHGKNSDISISRLKSYYKKTIITIEFIENQCNPAPL